MTDEQRKEAKRIVQARWRERHRLLIRSRRNAEAAARRAARLAVRALCPAPTTKTCAKCREEKPLDVFGASRGRSGGKGSYCRICKRAIAADYYAKHYKRERKPYTRDIQKIRAGEKRRRDRVPLETKRRDQARWRANNPERHRDHCYKKAATRRARKAGLFSEAIDRNVVYERDKGKCGICCAPVQRGEKWHVDHVIPLAKGGIHSYANVQLSHAACNIKKGAQLAA